MSIDVHIHIYGRMIMSTKTASMPAASIALILGTAGAFASEPDFRTPTTARAQEAQPVLARAAHAVDAGVPHAGYVSNLWIYPTAEEDVVFAQYVVTTNKASLSVSEQHFELLKLKSDRVIEQRDLTHAEDDVALRAKQTKDLRDWSASIGSGHAGSAPVTSATSACSPASPHRTASNGTGQTTGDSKRRLYATASSQSS